MHQNFKKFMLKERQKTIAKRFHIYSLTSTLEKFRCTTFFETSFSRNVLHRRKQRHNIKGEGTSDGKYDKRSVKLISEIEVQICTYVQKNVKWYAFQLNN